MAREQEKIDAAVELERAANTLRDLGPLAKDADLERVKSARKKFDRLTRKK